MARNAIMTPTNVYPRNGNVMVFDENNQMRFSFTNNSDAMAYFKFEFFDCATNENILNVVYHSYKYRDDRPVFTYQRGDTVRVGIDRTLFDYTFVDGRHYKYNIVIYCCNPDETGRYLNLPNCFVPYASGKVTYVSNPSKMTIQDHITNLHAPEYWGEEDLLISCTYMKIGNEERKVLTYDSTTGVVTLENPFSNEALSDAGNLHYRLFCNYISTSGSESEGSYDFYTRGEIESETEFLPVPVGLRCNCTYTHPNNVGLENYRYKVYAMQSESYINGVVQDTTSDISDLVDYRNIPIEKGILDSIIGHTIIFKAKPDTSEEGTVKSGYSGTIINYNTTTGIVTLERNIPIIPLAGSRYTINAGERKLSGDSDSVYSYHMCYNFPIYTFGKSFEIETILTTYEKQTLAMTDRVSFDMPTKDCPITQHEVIVNDSTQSVALYFPNSSKKGWYNIYRREKRESTWNRIGFMDHTRQDYFIDHFAGNHRNYEYLIAYAVNSSDTANNLYNADNNYKPYLITDVITDWDGWTITSLIPYSTVETFYNKNDIKTNAVSNTLSFIYAQEPYILGETWKFISAIESGDIIHNLGLTVHTGTSAFPTVTRTNNNYQSGSFTADLLSLECPSGKIYDDIEKVNRWIKFINGDNPFILKSDKGDVWIIAISENTSRRYDETTSLVLTNVSYSWVEIDKPENVQIVPKEHYST